MTKKNDNYTPTPEQSLAIDANGKILVSASAGSGKTTTLVKRIIRQISEGASLSRMLILVYNNAAADELREKLRIKLFESACEETGEVAVRFRKELDEIPFAEICTIHAFCRDLIRNNFELLGVSPSFRVLDEKAHTNYMAKAFDDLIKEYSEKNDEIFDKLTTVFECKRNEENIRKFVYTLFNVFDVQPNREEFANKIRSFYESRDKFDEALLEGSRATLKKVRACLEKVLPELYETKQLKYAENAEIAIGAIDVFLIPDVKLETVMNSAVSALNDFVRASKTKNAVPETIELVKKCIACVKDELSLYKSLYSDNEKIEREFAQNALYANKMLELTWRFIEILDKRKKDDDVLSFGDLEHYATKLIAENPDKNLAENYDYVFVDEYQDVNPVQENIISNMVKDNAFFVGDVKQSIYGFRLADPDIFLARKNAYKSGEDERALQIDFNNNFRSENQILEFVNGVFDVVMTEESASVDYKNDGRFVSRDERSGKVEVHLFTGGCLRKTEVGGLYDVKAHDVTYVEEGRNVKEGEFIVSKIKELISSPSEKISYSDITILFRGRNSMSERIVSTLRRYGIPLDDGAFSREKDRPEKDLISLLTVVDNPRQDFAFAGYLLSYLGGYSEDEVAEIAKSRNEVLAEKVKNGKEGAYPARADLYDGALRLKEEDSKLGRKVRSTLDKLDEYRLKASFKNLGELISGIISENYFDAYVLARGDSALNALHSFVAFASSDENADKSLSAFLRDYKNRTEDAESGKSSGGDRVAVSTFHGYKGLENKVVFVAGIGTPLVRNRASDLVISSNGIMGLTYFDNETKNKNIETLSKIVVKRFIAEKEYKEEMRLAYVALTRAQKYMYLTGTVPFNGDDTVSTMRARLSTADFEKPNNILTYVLNARNLGEDARIVIHDIFENLLGEAVILEDINARLLADRQGDYLAFADSIRKVQSFKYPYEEDTRLAMKYSVSELEGDIDESTVRTFDDKTNIGTAYHKVMQYVDFSAPSVEEVKAQMQKMLDDGLLLPEEYEIVKPKEIFNALQTDVIRFAAGCECLREQAFMMYKPAKEVVSESTSSEKVLVQGVVDLIILGKKSGGENIIVDYKYSALTNESARKKYEKQLNLYKTAAESVISGKIDRILLLSLKTGKTMEF